jgi:hypothetical protein
MVVKKAQDDLSRIKKILENKHINTNAYLKFFGDPTEIYTEDSLKNIIFFSFPMKTNGYFHITCGREANNRRELIIYTSNKVRWPLLYLAYVTSSELNQNHFFNSFDIFSFDDIIPEVPQSFNNCLFLDFSAIEKDWQNFQNSLKLESELLFVQLLTTDETKSINQNPTKESIVSLLMKIGSTFSSINRNSINL